jgi:omega-3 fatty acid desaturase (delta-15 desaturase)
MYHNHIGKDFSYSWHTPDILVKEERHWARFLAQNKLIMFFFPYYGFHLYLHGTPDGNHYIPWNPEDRLWRISPATERTKGWISLATVIISFYLIFKGFSGNWQSMFFYYFIPLIYFSWWLVTVTYLQHHSEDTVVYDDHDWTFLIGAFETYDRSFGSVIDQLHHHITDCHVIHHLFFTQIPHYHLPIATQALKKFLIEKNATKYYKYEKNSDFIFKIHRLLVEYGMKCRRASPIASEVPPISESTQ